MNIKLLSSIIFFGGLSSACGDLGNVDVALTFPTPATQAATRRLMFIVREVPTNGSSGCDALWTMQTNGLSESRSFVDYPNRNDVVAAAVKLSAYPKLTLLAYAYPNKDTTTSSPIAGGCQDVVVSPDSTMTVTIKLDVPPPTK